MTNASRLNRVERACAQLRDDGKDVTFTAVAATTGLGRTTLYPDPVIRAVIEEHRHHTATSGTLAGLTDEIEVPRAFRTAAPLRLGSSEREWNWFDRRRVTLLSSGKRP